MNTPPKGAKPREPSPVAAGFGPWSWPEGMGLVLGLALAAYYRAGFAEGPTVGTVSNFLELKWATAAIAGTVWGLLLATDRLPATPFRATWLDLALAGLGGWAVVSLAWSPDLAAAGLSGLYAAIALILYVLARITAPDALERLLVIAAGVLLTASLASWLLFGRAVDLGFGNENFSAEALVLCVCTLPLAWRQPVAWRRRLLSGIACLGLAYLLVLAPSNLQYGAVLAALWYLAVQRLAPRWAVVVTAALAVALVGGLAVWVSSDSFAGQFARLPEGWRERAQVWTNVAAGLADAPLWGHGWGSFYHSYAEYIDRYLTFSPALGMPAFDSFERSAGAAHNELLEVWYQLGVPGFLLAVCIVVLALVGALRTAPTSAPGWAGLGLAAWLAMAMIEFPGQNAASAALAILFLALVVPAAPAPRRAPALALRPSWIAAAAITALALAIPAAIQVRAQNRFAAGDLLHRSGQFGPAADRFAAALGISDWAPKLRLRLYPQSIVAGVPYWNQTGIPELERRYAVSASAAPHHPVLLDLRLKFLLALTNPPAGEVESALAVLKANSGLSNANAHVLDAAWALRLGDRDRARTSLALAEARLAMNPTAVSAANNRANTVLLRQQLAEGGG